MAKMNPILKESIQIVAFLLVAGAIVYFFWIYPLNRVSEIYERPETEQVLPDSLPPNNPEAFIEAGIELPDTIRIQTDGMTNLAGVYLPPILDSGQTPAGTIVLLHDERSDRTSLIPLGLSLNSQGLAILLLDQRSSGFSTGKFKSDGSMEATDLIEAISWIDLRTKLHPPLSVVGFGLGAEASLIASIEDDRIKKVVAVNPYLTSERMLAIHKAEHELMWFPFYNTITWWWYNTSSGYASNYRELDQLKAVNASTLVVMPTDQIEIPEINRLKELSGDKLSVMATPDSDDALNQTIIDYLIPTE